MSTRYYVLLVFVCIVAAHTTHALMAQTCSMYPQTVAELHDAVKRCDVELVEGADVKLLSGADERGFTALMWAAWLGHTEVGATLLELGASHADKDTDGQDALFHAAWQGEDEFVELLLDHSADPNSADADGETALMAAAHQGHVEIASKLVVGGADLGVKDRNGMTAKDHAVRWGHFEDLRYVLQPSHVAEMRLKYEHMCRDREENPIRRTAGVRPVKGVQLPAGPGSDDENTEGSQRSSSNGLTGGTESERNTIDDRTTPPPSTAVPSVSYVPNWVEVEVEHDEKEAESMPTSATSSDASKASSLSETGMRFPMACESEELDDILPSDTCDEDEPEVVLVDDDDDDDLNVQPQVIHQSHAHPHARRHEPWVYDHRPVPPPAHRPTHTPPVPEDSFATSHYTEESMVTEEEPDVLEIDGVSLVDINLWSRRGFAPLRVDTTKDEELMAPAPEDAAAAEDEAQFRRDVKRFLDSFPPVVTCCTICDKDCEDTSLPEKERALMFCQECNDTMCNECWKNEHQNKKRRHHEPKPAVTQASRFEAVAQVAVQLSRMLEKTERERDQAQYDHSQSQHVTNILAHDVHNLRTRSGLLEQELHRMEDQYRDLNDMLHTRDAKYQAYIKDMQARHAAELHNAQVREAELRRHSSTLQSELSEARRSASLKEAEFKLQIQTSNMRAQRATSHVEQFRVDMVRLRSENERAREEAARLRHRLELEKMKAQRFEEENRRLLRQIHRMMPEFEQRQRSRYDYTGFEGRSASGSSSAYERSGTAGTDTSGSNRTHHTGAGTGAGYSNFFRSQAHAPPPTFDGIRSSLPEPMKEALRKIKKYGLEDVENGAVDVIHTSLSSITIHEFSVLIGVSHHDIKAAKDASKKLLTKLHPDRSQQTAMKETLRKRFQIVNHTRGLLDK